MDASNIKSYGAWGNLRSLVIGAIGILFLVPLPAQALNPYCACVYYIRTVLGVEIRGDAWTIKPNKNPLYMDVGDVILIGKNHAALIVGFTGNRIDYQGAMVSPDIIISDTNYVAPCQPSTRKISRFSTSIRGIVSPEVN